MGVVRTMATLVISILGVELLLYLPSFNYFSLNRQVTFLCDILPGMMISLIRHDVPEISLDCDTLCALCNINKNHIH